jgi:hypothetical protein
MAGTSAVILQHKRIQDKNKASMLSMEEQQEGRLDFDGIIDPLNFPILDLSFLRLLDV